MTKKEQLYIQDVTNHAKQMDDLCNLCKNTVTDPSLKDFIEAVCKETRNTLTKVSSLSGQGGNYGQ